MTTDSFLDWLLPRQARAAGRLSADYDAMVPRRAYEEEMAKIRARIMNPKWVFAPYRHESRRQREARAR